MKSIFKLKTNDSSGFHSSIIRVQSPTTMVILSVFSLFGLLTALSGCGTETISPAYNNTRPEILSIELTPGDSIEIQDTLTVLSCQGVYTQAAFGVLRNRSAGVLPFSL